MEDNKLYPGQQEDPVMDVEFIELPEHQDAGADGTLQHDKADQSEPSQHNEIDQNEVSQPNEAHKNNIPYQNGSYQNSTPYQNEGYQNDTPYQHDGYQNNTPYQNGSYQNDASYQNGDYQNASYAGGVYSGTGSQNGDSASQQYNGVQSYPNTYQNSYQNTYQNAYQNSYQNNYQNAYQYNGQTELEEPVKISEWVLSMVLMMIPCVNIILMFVWAFSSTEKKSKSNFFKAYLIFFGIAMGLMLLVWIAVVFFAVLAY